MIVFVSEIFSLGALWALHYGDARSTLLLLEISRPPEFVWMTTYNIEFLKSMPSLESAFQIIGIWIYFGHYIANIPRVWKLLRERGYNLEIFMYLFATCLPPVSEAIGRPLLLVELYACGYAVYRCVWMVGWIIIFCIEYFDAPPLVPAIVASCARA